MDGYKKRLSKKVLDKEFIKSGYSILTTPKYDWYESINGEKDWSKTQNLIVKFWREFQNLKDGVFSNIIFPILPIEVKEEVKNFLMNLNNIGAIKFIECTFEDKIDFSEIEFKMPIEFNKSTFKENIDFEKSNFDTLTFKEVDFYKNVLIQNVAIKQFYLEKTIFQKDFIFNGNNSKEAKFNFIQSTFSKDSVIEFKDLSLKILNIEETNNHSLNFIFLNIEIKEFLKIKNSKLGVMNFNNINLSKGKLYIENSSLSNISLNSFKWCKITDLEANKDSIRQLKMALNNNHDYTTAHLIHSYEMYKYNKELYNEFFHSYRQNRKSIITNFYSLLKDIYLFLEKKLLLCFSYRVSIFSQSWIMPIIWIFIFHFIFSLSITFFIPFKDIITFFVVFTVLVFLFSNLLSKFKNLNLFELISFALLLIITTLFFIVNSEIFRILIDGIKFYYFPIHILEINYKIPLWFLNKFILSILSYHLIVTIRKPTRA